MFLILLSFFFIYADHYAILIGTSRYYINYRHAADVFVMYNKLITLGWDDRNIVFLLAEDPISDIRNPYPNSIFLDETITIPYFRPQPAPLSLSGILDILEGNHPKLISIDENDTVLVFISGHGAGGFLKILDKDYLFADDLMSSFLILSKRIMKLHVIIDTCNGDAKINSDLIPDNSCFYTTSKKNDSSYSASSNPLFGFPTVDEFALALHNSRIQSNLTLSTYYSIIFRPDLPIYNGDKFTVGDFYLPEKTHRKLYPFVL